MTSGRLDVIILRARVPRNSNQILLGCPSRSFPEPCSIHSFSSKSWLTVLSDAGSSTHLFGSATCKVDNRVILTILTSYYIPTVFANIVNMSTFKSVLSTAACAALVQLAAGHGYVTNGTIGGQYSALCLLFQARLRRLFLKSLSKY